METLPTEVRGWLQHFSSQKAQEAPSSKCDSNQVGIALTFINALTYFRNTRVCDSPVMLVSTYIMQYKKKIKIENTNHTVPTNATVTY